MNVNCIICSDVFTPSSEIYTTTCGHIFHFACLIQWIERSRSCPQCRSKATEKTIRRIYFNIAQSEGGAEDASTLQFKLDNLQFQMKIRDLDIKNLSEKHEKDAFQNKGLVKEVKTLEHEMRAKDSAMSAYKEQIIYFKEKSKEVEKQSDEIVRLKDKLRSVEDVQVIISGSRDEANEMLRHNRDPQTLALMVTTIKKELIESDRRRKKLAHSLKQVQSELGGMQRQMANLQEQNKTLREDVECHKNCDKERRFLKLKINELENAVRDGNDDVPSPRLISESPAPLRRQLLDNSSADTTFTKYESPPMHERVKHTLDSMSPYLPLKSSSMIGFSNLANGKTNSVSFAVNNKTNKHSIFNFTGAQTGIDRFKIPKKDVVYDGMGGYTKDDRFPSPIVRGFKRPKPSSSVSSSKFKKLAPNKKMADFFGQKAQQSAENDF